ncbi:ABC transporter ATP-binding protein [Maritalea mediterranea]|uniref:ABC transporter ATP-binding protein n=1 Tax=Maritalea mediterranea TaxID=2909667 RepID=A0ABS9E4B8_9HYPH|nr:ABC transporter ATP-binding protein [Maritalea mediterranea]MCF4097104.1 ABC transporter ATP-binding protein [Maritalea mediterranea]
MKPQMAATGEAMGAETILSVNNIEVVFNEVILVLRGLNLNVQRGKITALLGTNGAGKSTTLKAITNLLASEDGEVTRGSIEYEGQDITDIGPEALVRKGVFLVMEGRGILQDMTVIENLRLGAYSRPNANLKEEIEEVFRFFPRLKERTGLAGYLSGGEQQMLAIGRALMAKPKLILMDEPSMGLSPLLVKEVFGIIKRLNRELGISILLVEQNANMALHVADEGYIMENGKIVLDGTAEELMDNEDVKEFYLGGGGERRSFKDIKSYKRRKRWL